MASVILTKKQVAQVVNTAVDNTLGENQSLVTEDLQGVVDTGVLLANANAYENFVNNLMVATAKVIFAARKYAGKFPSVLRDNFEYGQLIQKIRGKLPEAVDNQSWQLTDGTSYDDNIFVADDIQTKIFKDSTTFEIRRSITNDQIKNAFRSAQELGNFVSMVSTLVENALTLRMESLIKMLIANMAGETFHTANAVRSVNLLGEYKVIYPSTTLTTTDCLYDKDFLKFATARISEYQGSLENYSVLFNESGAEVFTPKNLQHLVLLSKFADNCKTYLESDTWHNEFVKMPYNETVDAWQGNPDNTLANKAKIDITTSAGNAVTITGVLGVLFDHDALGVTQDDPSVETKYIRSAQFTNYWYKKNTMYFNDFDENFVLFYMAD